MKLSEDDAVPMVFTYSLWRSHDPARSGHPNLAGGCVQISAGLT